MKDMEKLCRAVESELDKIAEKGLNTGNLETAYKLIDKTRFLQSTNLIFRISILTSLHF